MSRTIDHNRYLVILDIIQSIKDEIYVKIAGVTNLFFESFGLQIIRHSYTSWVTSLSHLSLCLEKNVDKLTATQIEKLTVSVDCSIDLV